MLLVCLSFMIKYTKHLFHVLVDHFCVTALVTCLSKFLSIWIVCFSYWLVAVLYILQMPTLYYIYMLQIPSCMGSFQISFSISNSYLNFLFSFEVIIITSRKLLIYLFLNLLIKSCFSLENCQSLSLNIEYISICEYACVFLA